MVQQAYGALIGMPHARTVAAFAIAQVIQIPLLVFALALGLMQLLCAADQGPASEGWLLSYNTCSHRPIRPVLSAAYSLVYAYFAHHSTGKICSECDQLRIAGNRYHLRKRRTCECENRRRYAGQFLAVRLARSQYSAK